MAQSTKRSAANPYSTGGPSRYMQTRGGTSSIPVTGIRTGAKISVAGAPAAKGGAPAAKVPTGVEPGEPTAPEYNPIIDAETMSPPVDPNRQETIVNQARAPRFAIGNPNVGNIDLGSLLSAKPTKGFDPNAPVGGANVPFQETKGVGGFFRRMFGDTANEQNIAAQQQQAAEWKAEGAKEKERLAKREDLAEEIRLREAGPAERFKITQTAAEKAEANRVAAENKRLELEGQRLGLTKQQIEEARLDRVARLQAEKEERDIRIENMRTQNAINDAEFGLRSRVANQPRFGVHTTDKGGMTIFNQTTGEPVRTYTPGGIGMVKDAKGNMVPGTTQGGWEDYVPPVTVPKDLPDSPQVDRTTGAVPGGPLPDTKLPPGGGVRLGGRLPPPEVTPMRAAAPSPEADASLLGRFKTAMPSLSFAQPSGRGYQVAPLTEGDVAQQVMGQIAYPLRAAVGQQVKGQYTNPEEAAMSMEYPMPASRFRRPSAKEQAEALAAGDLIRKMYAE